MGLFSMSVEGAFSKSSINLVFETPRLWAQCLEIEKISISRLMGSERNRQTDSESLKSSGPAFCEARKGKDSVA